MTRRGKERRDPFVNDHQATKYIKCMKYTKYIKWCWFKSKGLGIWKGEEEAIFSSRQRALILSAFLKLPPHHITHITYTLHVCTTHYTYIFHIIRTTRTTNTYHTPHTCQTIYTYTKHHNTHVAYTYYTP